ncbi:unnamed protein product [marine sediment metagenome]|uniref:Uncharacterized protein n=1 Tax=marine sediment metagenome TaxID=412755 RepID=X0RGU8_9ZZZZ
MNLENECWACGGPLDESKPVTSHEKEEEEEIDIEKIEKSPKNA